MEYDPITSSYSEDPNTFGNQSPTLSDDQVQQYLDSFRQEYDDKPVVMDEPDDSSIDYSGYANLTGPELAKLAAEIAQNEAAAGMNANDILSILKSSAGKLLFDSKGKFDFGKLLTLGGGLLAANKPNSAAPTGYQGKIPKLTATSNMLTAPPVGRRPGSGGINYGGGATYRDENGNIVSSNEKTLEELRQAAINNPFNRGSTYEGGPAFGGTDLVTLLNALNPPTAPTAPTTPVVGGGVTPTGPAASSNRPVPTAGGIAGQTTRPLSGAASTTDNAALRAQLRAEFEQGPKTQDALDKLLLKYPPAVMQSEFPEFGGVANYNKATMEAYQREERKLTEANRAAMRASGQDVSVEGVGKASPYPSAPQMSAIPQAELAAARAKLTPEQAATIDWQLAQINPMTGQRVADEYARQGANPYESGTRAQELIDRGVRRTDLLSQSGVSTEGVAPWTNPNWLADQQAAENAERARMDKITAEWYNIPEGQRPVVGGGGTTSDQYPASYGPGLDKPIPVFSQEAGIAALAPAPAAPAAPVAAAPAPAPAAPAAAAPAAPTPEEIASWGYAKGGLARDGFVVPADVVSHFGNGSSEAGLKLLASKLGATPIKGDGDGMSDSIPTKIDGVQEARVANDEAYVSPEMVAKLGNGNPEKGARKLYAMMDKIRKARTGSTEQGKEIDPNKYMPGGSVRYATGGTTVPTGATGSESSLSNWAGDYVTNMLGQGAALANKPYEAYTGPLTAGASGLQNQAFNMASNLQTPGAIGQAAGTAGGIANLAANMRYTPQTTDFLGGANMSGLGVAPSYGMGMPQQQPMGTYNNPIPVPRGNDNPKFLGHGPATTGEYTGGFDEPTPVFDTSIDYGPDPLQKQRPSPAGGGESFQTKPFMQDGAMTGGVMQPPQAGIPGALPQASQQVGNIAQQYMNPYLESALRPQMAEMQRAADIARMSDAARLTQAGAFGGSRQAIMESEGRRNLLGKQSDALAQGYSTAYDKAMAQFNADQARRANEAQFGATFGLQGLQTGTQAAQAQAQAGAMQSQSDLNNLKATLDAGGVERGIESEGIAADKAQFEEARLNPYKMVQFQQSLLSGMPLNSQSYSVPGQSNLQQFAGGADTIYTLLKKLGVTG